MCDADECGDAVHQGQARGGHTAPLLPVPHPSTATATGGAAGGGNQKPIPELTRTTSEVAATSVGAASPSYLTPPTGGLVPLRAARIGLPTRPGSVGLTDLMDDEHRRRFDQPKAMLRDPAAGGAETPTGEPTGRVGGEAEEYVSLVRRCTAAGMWGRYRGGGPPPVINGVFTVAKDEVSDRLIIDARAANRLFAEPDPVALPSPDVIAELYSESGCAMYVGKTDLSDFYHQIRLPDWMHPYFCLPPVRACDLDGGDDATPVYPMSLVLPMGWSWSVVAAQLIHENVIRRAGLFDRAPALTRLGSGCVGAGAGRARIQCYIDDVIVYGTDRQEVVDLQADYVAAIQAAGLTVKASKTVLPRTEPPVKCVGIEVDGKALTAGVADEDLRELIRDTRALLRARFTSAEAVERVVGCWTWAMAVRRSAMCVFNAVYRFVQSRVRSDNRRGALAPLWRSAAHELTAACDLAPLLRVQLNGPITDDVVATDASSRGYGVAVRTAPEAGPTRAGRRVAAATISEVGLRLAARARSTCGDGQSQTRAAETLRALSDRATRIVEGLADEREPVWAGSALPCVAAARAGEVAPERDAVEALPRGYRVLSAERDSVMAGYRSVYERLTGYQNAERRAVDGVWTSAVSGVWNTTNGDGGEHINIREVRAAGYGVNEAVRRGCALDGRVVVLLDSVVALSALAKGRSSSFGVLRAVRRVNAGLLATGIRPLYRFVESECNPADLPSRTTVGRGDEIAWRGGGFAVDVGRAERSGQSDRERPAGHSGGAQRQ